LIPPTSHTNIELNLLNPAHGTYQQKHQPDVVHSSAEEHTFEAIFASIGPEIDVNAVQLLRFELSTHFKTLHLLLDHERLLKRQMDIILEDERSFRQNQDMSHPGLHSLVSSTST
jgi:hypothetical protein